MKAVRLTFCLRNSQLKALARLYVELPLTIHIIVTRQPSLLNHKYFFLNTQTSVPSLQPGSFVRRVIFLHTPLLPCWKLFDCSSSGGPVIPRMYAVDVSRPVRDLSLSQGKPSSTSEGENPLQSLRGHISASPSSPVPASYWPLQSWKCPASLIQRVPSSPHACSVRKVSAPSHAMEKNDVERGVVVLQRF